MFWVGWKTAGKGHGWLLLQVYSHLIGAEQFHGGEAANQEEQSSGRSQLSHCVVSLPVDSAWCFGDFVCFMLLSSIVTVTF